MFVINIIIVFLLCLCDQVLDTSPELRPVAMETLICMVTQLGQRYKIFIPAVKKVTHSQLRGIITFSMSISRMRVFLQTCT